MNILSTSNFKLNNLHL